jgi:hypothetical protein
MAEWKSYHFRCTSANPRSEFFHYLKKFLVDQGWALHDEYAAQKAAWTISGSSNINNNETITIAGKTYTFKTTLTATEGEVLIGGSGAAALDNLKLAVNRTDPETNNGVKYQVAEAHPYYEATTNTDTTQRFDRLVAGESIEYANSPGLAETMGYYNWAGITQYGRDATVVFKTNGESGEEPYGYLWLQSYADNGCLYFRAYQYWDAVAHTGARKTYLHNGNGEYVNNWSTGYDCLIAGDKDMVYANSWFAVGDPQNRQLGFICGHVPKRSNQNIIKTTDAVEAGSNVTIPVTDATKLPGYGGYFQIVGAAGEGCDKLQVVERVDSTHVKVASLPRNYASGAFLGFPASTFLICTSYSGYNDQYAHFTSWYNDAGLTVGDGHLAWDYWGMGSVSGLTGKRWLTRPFLVEDGHLFWGWFDDPIYCCHTGVATWDVVAMNDDGSIVTTNMLATSATANTITDSTRNWTTDQFAGKYVVLVGGTGINQVRKILSNDATTITVDGENWYTTPDGTTTFRVYDQCYRCTPNVPFYGFWNATKIMYTAQPPLPS